MERAATTPAGTQRKVSGQLWQQMFKRNLFFPGICVWFAHCFCTRQRKNTAPWARTIQKWQWGKTPAGRSSLPSSKGLSSSSSVFLFPSFSHPATLLFLSFVIKSLFSLPVVCLSVSVSSYLPHFVGYLCTPTCPHVIHLPVSFFSFSSPPVACLRTTEVWGVKT